MRLSLSKALIVSVPAILLYFVPAAMPVVFLRAAFLHEAGRRHSNSALGSFVNEIGIVLALCVWLGVRLVWKAATNGKEGEDTNETGPPTVPWLVALPWSLVLAALLTLLYEICFVAALFLTNQTNQGFADVSAFSRFWSAYWPDPRSVGFALFAFAALAMEPVAAVSFFVAALVSYRTAPRLYPKRTVPKHESLL
jgi:hypothetical protein